VAGLRIEAFHRFAIAQTVKENELMVCYGRATEPVAYGLLPNQGWTFATPMLGQIRSTVNTIPGRAKKLRPVTRAAGR
jgi:hypothetical protein